VSAGLVDEPVRFVPLSKPAQSTAGILDFRSRFQADPRLENLTCDPRCSRYHSGSAWARGQLLCDRTTWTWPGGERDTKANPRRFAPGAGATLEERGQEPKVRFERRWNESDQSSQGAFSCRR
jgi:hypothetical protein